MFNQINYASLRTRATATTYFPTVVLFVMSFFPCVYVHAAASFTPLGLFGGVESRGLDVSADGSAVVGQSTTGVFYWTRAESMIQPANGSAVSANGKVVVGYKSSFFGFEAFKWTIGGDFQLLGDLPGGSMNSAAFDVSDDGTLIVGQATPSFPNEPFPAGWTVDGPFRLFGLGAGAALGVSADGNVIVGIAGSEAFRRVGGIATSLGVLPGARSSAARAVSTDGGIVVGDSSFPLPVGSSDVRAEAFRWTQATGMVSLGDFPGGRVLSTAYDVSGDGSVIVGAGEMSFDGTFGTNQAFYWTAGTGMLNLRDYLIANGATGLDGWTLTEARGVSWDGQTIVGTGVHNGITEGFVATIPEPSTIVLAVVAGLAIVVFWRV